MTEFTQTLRHYCRNPRCRSKLPSPVSNAREAFCTKGCHSSFYFKRCVACEAPFTKRRANQEVCWKARCRRAFREAKERFRYYPTSAAFEASKSPDSIGSKPPPASDRPWRVVAGPEPSPSALHCATIGAAESIEAISRTNARHWREHNARAEEKCLIKRHDPPGNTVGGYKFPGAPAVDLNPSDVKPVSAPLPAARLSIDRSGDIPDFLHRTSLNAPQSFAA
jgi:hypothetical protein